MYSSVIDSKKPNLVFLHGWGGCWQSWYPILERLKKDFNLYAPDLPGFGQEPIPNPYHLENYVDFVINFIKKNKIKNPILIGHSFGGAIISKIAADKSISFPKMILVDAASIRHPYSTPQKIKFQLINSLKKVFPFTQDIYYKIFKLQNSDYAAIKNNPILRQTFKNVIQQDLTNDLPKIEIPTLIIWGKNDVSTPLSDGQKIHQLISNSQLIVFSDTSHFSYLDDQEQFVTEVKNFINQ
jgi:pimeloyl-ACP methyl ester carboxylesterase